MLGFGERAGERTLRFDVERLPLADGRFHLHLGLLTGEGGPLLHWLDEALPFLVYPGEGERGPVLLEGSWTTEEIGPAAELRGDELPHLS